MDACEELKRFDRAIDEHFGTLYEALSFEAKLEYERRRLTREGRDLRLIDLLVGAEAETEEKQQSLLAKCREIEPAITLRFQWSNSWDMPDLGEHHLDICYHRTNGRVRNVWFRG